MNAWSVEEFGIENLRIDHAPTPQPRPGEIRLDVKAFSLNYRDLMVVSGQYNPKLKLPAVPVSDAAGVVSAVGEGVRRVRVGDRVMTHYVAPWIDGPFRSEYLAGTLGTPGPGFAAQQVVVSADAVLPIPADYDFAQAATLPIAALTAWSALVTEGGLAAGQTLLALGTGGVSIFALQFAKAIGARVFITSGSDAKLERARLLGADETINYRQTPDWDKSVLALTDGRGVDLTVEVGGAGTLERSIRATRGGGIVALIGVLSGVRGEFPAVSVLMKRQRVQGILVDSRGAFENMVRFIERHRIRPVIDRTFAFEQLPQALRAMQAGEHFGKIVVRVAD